MQSDDDEKEILDSDWYHDSDTSADIPDPNLENKNLYQDVDNLPESLDRKHFVEGLLYTMTLDGNRGTTMLIMVIEKKERDFVYRVFFSSSKRKTFHDGAADKTELYSEV